MGRPPRHDADSLLDAAVALVTESGPGAVTMASVARKAGASSGSVYHRFPDQASLLSALWLRTVTRFQQGFFEVVATESPYEAAVASACHVVEWSRQHPDEALVLLVGAKNFGEAEWPKQARDQLADVNREVQRALRGLARRLGRTSKAETRRVVLAVVDLPYAVVRRHLSTGMPIPRSEVDLVADAVSVLLAPAA